MVHVGEKIKFRACLLQDTPHRYLEKFLPKQKRFIVRQVTETKDEELYVNCGHFELSLDIYAMKPSGQEITVNFVDPNGKASGTVTLKVEHEPRVVMSHYLPNFSNFFKRLLKPKLTTKNRISKSRLEHNREKLEFIKQKCMVNHWSHKYDGLSDSESEDEDTLSESGESEEGDSPKTQKRLPTKSFIMNRTGMPQMSSKGGSSKHHVSAMLRSHMFNFGEEEGEEILTTPQRPPENASFDENDNKVNTVSFYETVTHFEPDGAQIGSSDTCSTLTRSEQNHLSPRVDTDSVIRRPELVPEIYRKPSVQMMRPARLDLSAEGPTEPLQALEDLSVTPKSDSSHSPHGPQIIGHLLPGNTHVPFSGQSYKVRASSVLICESEDELSNADKIPAIELKTDEKLSPVQEEELWEDPADFDRLESKEDEELVLEGGSYKPRKSLRHVPPPLISDKSQFIPARTVQRSASITATSMGVNEANLPKYEPPPPVPQPPRKSLRGVPPPVPEKESFVPARVVTRVNSESSTSRAQALLNMDSRDEREASPQVTPRPVNPPLMSYQSEYNTMATEAKKVHSPSPVVRHLVPVRLSAQESAALTSPPSASVDPPRQHHHIHHRAASTGDMYAGIGHRHIEDAHSHTVSVKELRRKFERPPLIKESSSGSGEKKYPPLSSRNLPPADPAIRFQRGNSETSFSTLTTHTDLDKPKHRHTRNPSNGAPAKILIPVRLNNSQEEQAYRAQEGVRSPQSVASLSVPRQQEEHRHQHSHSNVHNAHAERHDRYHDAQGFNADLHHSKGHPPTHSQSQGDLHHAAPYGHAYRHDGHNHHHGTEASHSLHRAHSMAPPIRLKANDYVPPVYERYVTHEHPHIYHHHHHSGSVTNTAYNTPHEGSYTARSLNNIGGSPPPAAYRSVYA